MILNILISTIDNRIDDVVQIVLPMRSDVKYFITHQCTEYRYARIPEGLRRDDVYIFHMQGKGLTKSRNNTIRNATGDVCLIADDDVRYSNEYFDTILSAYKDESLDFACFKINTGDENLPYKDYPQEAVKLTRKYYHTPSSIEITFRLKSIRESEMWFDERFGLGARIVGGEERLFILDAFEANLNVWFFPEYVVNHPYDSSVKKMSKYDTNKVSMLGAMDAKINGWISIPKAVGDTGRLLGELIKYRKNPFLYCTERIKASFYILSTEKDKMKKADSFVFSTIKQHEYEKQHG